MESSLLAIILNSRKLSPYKVCLHSFRLNQIFTIPCLSFDGLQMG